MSIPDHALKNGPKYQAAISVPVYTEAQGQAIKRQLEQMFTGFACVVSRIPDALPVPPKPRELPATPGATVPAANVSALLTHLVETKHVAPGTVAEAAGMLVTPAPAPMLPTEFFRDKDSGCVVSIAESGANHHVLRDENGGQWPCSKDLFDAVYERHDPNSTAATSAQETTPATPGSETPRAESPGSTPSKLKRPRSKKTVTAPGAAAGAQSQAASEPASPAGSADSGATRANDAAADDKAAKKTKAKAPKKAKAAPKKKSKKGGG
jgi:hypothetical protein